MSILHFALGAAAVVTLTALFAVVDVVIALFISTLFMD